MSTQPTFAAAPGFVPASPSAVLRGGARGVLRRLPLMVVLCVAIASLNWLIDRHWFGWKLVYSFSIGFCCWFIIEGLRLLTHWVMEKQRFARQLPSTGVDVRLGWLAMLPIVLLSVLLGPTLGLAIGDGFSGSRSNPIWQWGSLESRITLAITIAATAISLVGFTVMDRLARLREQEAHARQVAAENQLRLLQSQLEPHMLFNTLANLRVLIGVDSARAQEMLDRLIGFLRSTLAASRQPTHPLGDEFARLHDYLALIAIRMGPRLRIELDLPADLHGLLVPPLLLQPLVENSIQHGLEPKVEGGTLIVKARRSGDALVLKVIDDGVGLSQTAHPHPGASRFGVQQVRDRLATLYGGSARFSLRLGEPMGTVAEVVLPLGRSSKQ
jgi:sensor histidine kinase YesM